MSSMVTQQTKSWRRFRSRVSRILIQQQQQPRISQLWYWLYMWWCSWLLLLSLTDFLCPVLVLTCKQDTVPLPLFYIGSFVFVSVPLPWESPSFGNWNFPCLRQACKGMEWQKGKKRKCCKPRIQLLLCSACACDSRKLKDYRETNLFSILTDFKLESMALSFCQPKLWWIILGLNGMGPSKVVTSQWRRSRSIMGRWVTHASVVETLGPKPKMKRKNLFKHCPILLGRKTKAKQFDKAVWGQVVELKSLD